MSIYFGLSQRLINYMISELHTKLEDKKLKVKERKWNYQDDYKRSNEKHWRYGRNDGQINRLIRLCEKKLTLCISTKYDKMFGIGEMNCLRKTPIEHESSLYRVGFFTSPLSASLRLGTEVSMPLGRFGVRFSVRNIFLPFFLQFSNVASTYDPFSYVDACFIGDRVECCCPGYWSLYHLRVLREGISVLLGWVFFPYCHFLLLVFREF